jgi:RNA polymerase subunit RPABC4/transcription elongation factor Spt4
MTIRHYHDFVIFTDDVKKDRQKRVRSFTVRVFDSPVGQGEKKERVRVPDKVFGGTVDWIEALRMLETRDLDQKVDKQMELGEVLAGLLLPEYARELFEKSLAWLGEDEGIRLRLRLADELLTWPWEYMYIQDMRGERKPSSFLALDVRISIARHQAIALPVQWFGGADRRRIVVAMASPEPHAEYRKLVNLPKEQRAIRAALSNLPGLEVEYLPEYDGAYDDGIPGAGLSDVMKALSQPTDVFHFGGHGEFLKQLGPGGEDIMGQGGIILADRENQAVPLPGDRLMEILRGKGVRLVVLGACETARRDTFHVWSSVAASLLRGGIPAVVAMQFSIQDDLAAAFMADFYEALVAGKQIDEALALGRAAIRAEALNGRRDIRDWGVPALYLGTPHGRVFNPVSDEQALQEAERRTRRRFDQHMAAVATTGRVVGAVTKDVEVDEVEVIQRVDQDLEGLLIGTYSVDFRGDQITVRQELDRVTGVVIGGVLTGKQGWEALDAMLEQAFRPERPVGGAPAPGGEAEQRLCPQCQKPVQEDWTVCPYCQADLRPETTCPNCGNAVEPDWAVCPYCRTSLR